MENANSSLILELTQVTLPNYTFPFKLEHNNYIVWKAQIYSAIFGSNMEGFITGVIQPPPEFIEQKDKGESSKSKLFPNLVFLHMCRLDQALLGWICSSISLDIQGYLTKKDTCFEIWNSCA